MINMEPVLKRGYTAWDGHVLPLDEYDERIANVRAALRQQGLDGLVVVNYSLLGAMFDYADLAYLAGLQSGGVLLLTHDADPVLVSFGGGRELSFLRRQTWLSDVVAGRGDTFGVVRDRLQAGGIAGGAIGTVGTGGMPESAAARLAEVLGDYVLRPFDAELRALRARKRPRELMAVRIAKGIVDDAVEAAERRFADGGDNTAALLEAERVARAGRARDVRVLANMSGGGLRPFEGRLDGRQAPLLLWVAAQYQGYWAEASSTWPRPAASAAGEAVEAMRGAVRTGACAGDIAAAALGALPAAAADSALGYGLGGTTGLALNEGIEIRPDSDDVLPQDALLTLRTLVADDGGPSFAGTLVRVDDDGAHPVDELRPA